MRNGCVPLVARGRVVSRFDEGRGILRGRCASGSLVNNEADEGANGGLDGRTYEQYE